MTHELTHASFFSGVGGLDLGLERAGWRTVSFSEIDPYACAVLAERWPDVPNLGSIVQLDRGEQEHGLRSAESVPADRLGAGHSLRSSGAATATLWTGGFPCQDLSVAGKRRGFGTRDLDPGTLRRGASGDRAHGASTEPAGGERGVEPGVAGGDRYAGLTRSGLAFAFLDLVERHRPPAIVLENVPGLLSSNGGRDLGALLGRLGELGYWWAYRVLDARHFGVPQRRRRVFIVAIHARVDPSGDGPAEVLSVGSRCDRHPATGGEARAGAPGGADDGADIVGTIPAGLGHHGNGGHSSQAVASGHVIPGLRPSPDADRVRAADGLAGRAHDHELAHTLTAPDARHRVVDGKRQDGSRLDRIPHVVVNALDQRRGGADDNEAQAGHLVVGVIHPDAIGRDGVSRTPGADAEGRVRRRDAGLGVEDGSRGSFNLTTGQPPAVAFVKRGRAQTAEDGETWGEGEVMPTLNGFDVGDVRTTAAIIGTDPGEDPLLPLGLDSHRYRCCGNGVVADVAEWLGQRLAGYFA